MEIELSKPLYGTKFSEHRDKIKAMLEQNNGYCISVIKYGNYDKQDFLCPCKDYREINFCKCGLYIKGD